MSDPANPLPSTVFGSMATAYELGRPTYPAAAIADIFQDCSVSLARPVADVIDVGAGSGKLTEGLLGPGRRVSAVDPDTRMLEVLSNKGLAVDVLVGSAESLPLTDNSADLVVCGQAWHWVEPVAASQEIARVMRSGGVLALLWNVILTELPWDRSLSAALRSSPTEMLRRKRMRVSAPFRRLDYRAYRWQIRYGAEELEALADSLSYLIDSNTVTQLDIRADIREMVGNSELAEQAISIGYETHVFTFVRP